MKADLARKRQEQDTSYKQKLALAQAKADTLAEKKASDALTSTERATAKARAAMIEQLPQGTF